MAAPKWTAEQWTQHGMEAIVDLASDREVVTWGEVEARITAGWKDFRRVQPIQLSGALRRLLSESAPRIKVDETAHSIPIRTLRVLTNGNKVRVEKLRGANESSTGATSRGPKMSVSVGSTARRSSRHRSEPRQGRPGYGCHHKHRDVLPGSPGSSCRAGIPSTCGRG
jgi:hypothetical protein